MSTINIFCIVGKTGSGKSKYYNSLIKNNGFLKTYNIVPLVYGTTRSKRPGEVEGVDYYYHTETEFSKIDDKDMIEFRSYHTLNDGLIYYFTKTEYFKTDNNVISITSPYQYECYRTWCMNENIKYPNKYKLHMILIDTKVETRILRVLERANNDDDIYELCRRVVEERVEFDQVSKRLPELMDPILSDNVCFVGNNKNGRVAVNANLDRIKSFIANSID